MKTEGQTTPALYVHIPFCSSKCRYCAFYSEPIGKHDPEKLIDAELRELDSFALEAVDTIYIGGGSPSVLSQDLLCRLVRELAGRFPSCVECTVELNPAQTTDALFQELYALGVNRVSIGAQSFDPDDLTFLKRPHSYHHIIEAVEQAFEPGLENISLDLIFAIPGSDIYCFEYSLKSAMELQVPHLSAYSLSIESHTPLKRALDAGKFEPVDEETDRKMYELAIDKLTAAGLLQYEISNFARPDYQCRHNMHYWSGDDFLGIGPAAHSFFAGKRTENIPDIEKYIEAIETTQSPVTQTHQPTEKELACEIAILNLRRISGIDLKDFHSRTGFDAAQLFAPVIEKHKSLGNLTVNKTTIALTRAALPIADSVLTDFATTE